MKKANLKKGFTIFEMMVVVMIVGFILAIAIPNYIRERQKATTSICNSNQKMIYTAASVYQLREEDSLDGMGAREAMEALRDKRYLRGFEWAECPAERDGSYDDYIMEFEGGYIADVDCAARGDEHLWQ